MSLDLALAVFPHIEGADHVDAMAAAFEAAVAGRPMAAAPGQGD